MEGLLSTGLPRLVLKEGGMKLSIFPRMKIYLYNFIFGQLLTYFDELFNVTLTPTVNLTVTALHSTNLHCIGLHYISLL